jgi:hypothetical protein|tara:strand:- start:887 stop:1378 length:492 start_codon:yes stop_codon:yes gene_type:complete
MDYYPVSYWDDDKKRWIECGRFYENALIIDFKSISDTQTQTSFRSSNSEFVFRAPRFDVDWKDAPGSANWSLNNLKNNLRQGNVAGIFVPNSWEVTEGRNDDFHFGIDLPPPEEDDHIIVYYNERLSDTERSNLYVWKSWPNQSLSTLFDVYHASINVKDISR